MISGIVGDLSQSSTNRLEGWCWANNRAKERLTVEILLDGKVVTSVTAGRFNSYLRETGIGDGYHAFSSPIPGTKETLDSLYVFEARERVSRYIFGRIIFRAGAGHDDINLKLAKLNDAIGILTNDLNCSSQSSNIKRYSQQLNSLAIMLKYLARSSNRNFDFKRASKIHSGLRLINDQRRVALSFVRNPLLSIICPALDSWQNTQSHIQNINYLLEKYDCEMILIDNGDDPFLSLSGTNICNLRYVFHSGQRASSAAKNAAALIARGRHLCFLDDLHTGVNQILMDAKRLASVDLVIGPLATKMVARLGLKDPIGILDFVDHEASFAMSVRAPVFAAVQGFDETMENSTLSIVDFAMKAALLKIEVIGAKGDGISGTSGSFLNPEDCHRFNKHWDTALW